MTDILTSGRSFDRYCELLKLTKNDLKKVKLVLDVGAGFSGFTGSLLENGKNAYAVDSGYYDLNNFIKKYFDQKISESSEKFHKKFVQDKEKYQRYLEMQKSNQEEKERKVNELLMACDKFKSHFISASCFALPFNDKSFDLAVSIESLGNLNYFSYEEFVYGLIEMQRVAKEVRIYSAILNKKVLNDFKENLNLERKLLIF